MRRTRTSRLAAAVCAVTAVTFVAICAPPAEAAPSPMSRVQVVGGSGEKPTLEFAKPFAVTKSVVRVVHRAPGDPAKRGQRVSYQFVLVDGRTGRELATSYGRPLASLVLNRVQNNPALVAGMIGITAGTQILVAVAPTDGVAKGYRSLGAQAHDTLLYVVDAVSVHPRLTTASGTAVALPTGLPQVEVAPSGRTTITAPSVAPSSRLVVQPLIVGTGPTITSGQSVTLQETGIIWAGGRTFVDTRARGGPTDTPLGVGESLPAFDAGLIGQNIGSRVLLVVPPDQGYGAAGAPQFGIAGTDTLVYVIDILDAY